MADLLSDQAIDDRLRESTWRRDGHAIVRDLEFGNFREAIAFVNRVAEAAESANHHPDITVHGYKRVRLELSTHSAGGITDTDFDLASQIDTLT